MTELASHQLEVCCWAMDRVPESVMGMGDIVYWKDGREVYDSVNLVYHYNNGVKINYESLISNKFNGMEDQILGKKGTMNLATGIYYLEEESGGRKSGIEQLIGQIGNKIYASVPAAGPSWRPETKEKYIPHNILSGMHYRRKRAKHRGGSLSGHHIVPFGKRGHRKRDKTLFSGRI